MAWQLVEAWRQRSAGLRKSRWPRPLMRGSRRSGQERRSRGHGLLVARAVIVHTAGVRAGWQASVGAGSWACDLRPRAAHRHSCRGSWALADACCPCPHLLPLQVHHCHLLGVMHRDIKPENFLLTDESDKVWHGWYTCRGGGGRGGACSLPLCG